MEIKIRNLTKKFDDVTAINNLNIDISEGVTGLMGENGAGKSTLFRLISDVIYPNSGEILIDNEPARTKHAKDPIENGANIIDISLDMALIDTKSQIPDIDDTKLDSQKPMKTIVII